MNGAAHAGAKAAAHSFFKGILAGGLHHILHGLEHGHGAAGVEIGVLQVLDHIGDKTLGADAAVSSGDVHFCAQGLEFLCQEDFCTGVEAQYHLGMLALSDQLLAQVKHGRHANTAAHQHRAVAGEGSVITIAQAGQHIQLGANR